MVEKKHRTPMILQNRKTIDAKIEQKIDTKKERKSGEN